MWHILRQVREVRKPKQALPDVVAVPKEQIAASEQIAAALFFEHVFGNSGAVRGLNFLIALSAFGNLVAVLLGTSRLIRECGRQGVLPFTKFWVSTKPFGTALGPYTTKWVLTVALILILPAGDAFNFISDVQVYTAAFFYLCMGVWAKSSSCLRCLLTLLGRPLSRAQTTVSPELASTFLPCMAGVPDTEYPGAGIRFGEQTETPA